VLLGTTGHLGSGPDLRLDRGQGGPQTGWTADSQAGIQAVASVARPGPLIAASCPAFRRPGEL